MLQTYGKFMKYVIFTLHRMTPEQMKMNSIPAIHTSQNPCIKERRKIDT